MKRLIVTLLTAALLLNVAACSGTNSKETASEASQTSANTPETTKTAETTTEAETTEADSLSEAMRAMVGTYHLINYYNPEPFTSWLYPELRNHEDTTGEEIGTLILNEDGTAQATYPGEKIEFTWDDKTFYINEKPIEISTGGDQIYIPLENDITLTYSQFSEEEIYKNNVEHAAKRKPIDESDYTLGEPVMRKFHASGKDRYLISIPVTNNSTNKTLVLDMVTYALVSPSGEEKGYRYAWAGVTHAILPGETGYLFDQTLVENIPENVTVQPDISEICEWTGEYNRFEIRNFEMHTTNKDNVVIHRPTGVIDIPAGYTPNMFEVDVICLGKDGSFIGYGCANEISRDVNPFNYLEIPEGGGEAEFLVNMDGLIADPSFDTSQIDHYEYIASDPYYYSWDW